MERRGKRRVCRRHHRPRAHRARGGDAGGRRRGEPLSILDSGDLQSLTIERGTQSAGRIIGNAYAVKYTVVLLDRDERYRDAAGWLLSCPAVGGAARADGPAHRGRGEMDPLPRLRGGGG